MEGIAYDDWRLVLLAPWPWWVLALLAAAAVAGVVFAAWGLRKERRQGRRIALLGLRTLAMIAALFLLLEPGVRHVQTATVRGRLAVLVDDSASMAFPGEGAGSRAEEAATYLEAVRPSLAALEDRYHLEFHRFSDRPTPTSWEGIGSGLSAAGEATDLVGALEGLPGGTGSRRLAGALLLSDGTDNASLATGFGAQERERLRTLGFPVSTVAVGSPKVRDLAVEEVRVEDFAFVRNTVDVEVTLAATDMGAIDVPVVLRRDGQVIAQQTVSLRKGETAYAVKLSFVPDQIGEFVFTVSVPVYEGEATPLNNSESFVLQVIRDRVRTLHVVGRPSWDQRFLRTLLRDDPNVDLVSFYILRTQQDQPRASESELSLIPFPVDEIFEKQLWSFDLVIFQNFNYRPYRMDRYLPNLRRYVEEGGSFVMIGGDESFGEGGYQTTPIAEILPVLPVGAAPNEEAFAPRLTEAGRRHPITQLARGGESNEQAWASLPAIPGINVTQAKPGAHVLLEHPHVVVGGQSAPVVAVAEVGRGRTLAVTTDASWHWSLVAAGQGEGSRAYERFWSSAIRWLVRDPDLKQVQVQVAQRRVAPEVPIAASITARKPDYGPAAHATIGVRLIDTERGVEVGSQQVVAGADGLARVEFAPPGVGAYRVEAEARDGEAVLGQGLDVVAVGAATLERSDARPRHALLEEIAEVTQGASTHARERALPALRLPPPEVVEIGRSEDRPIWDRLWPLAWLAVCLAGEWVLRRRWGYA